MKYVRKVGLPPEYRAWCTQVKGTAIYNESYGCLQNPAKRNLHRALLREQGWLCAYTMRRIDESSSHIEHIKPESVCRSERIGLDLDYKNLVACFPRDGMGRDQRYGAQCKANWWDDDGAEFVSPLESYCENRFRFYLSGKIGPVGNHRAATTTIKILGLDHKSLEEDRKRVIEEFVYGPSRANPVSKPQAMRAIGNICNSDASGRFYEFCVAIRDALRQHIQQLKKLSLKRRFVARR